MKLFILPLLDSFFLEVMHLFSNFQTFPLNSIFMLVYILKTEEKQLSAKF